MSVAVSLVAVLYACKPDAYKTVGLPVDAVGSLSGTWRLTKVTQTDENAKNNGFTYDAINIQTADITNVFPYSDFKITFNFANGTPSTFTTLPGNSPKVIKLASGNWSLDDPKYPQVITLINAPDTARITLGAYPVAGATSLKIASQKRDAVSGKLLVSYSYEFTKQ